MTLHRPGPNALRFALASALAATMLTGCAGGNARVASGVSQADVSKAARSDEKALKRAEQAVAKAPRDAALRASLGQHYLRMGRFASAAAAFNDAMELGENSARTALGLVLADIALGKQRDAIALLDDWRDSLPAGDLGLAVALAGDPSRGVAILSDALRGGEATPKLRQNLAYAYALDGRWTEARIMMTQDVPADELNLRLSQWAASSKPELYQTRVAALLGAPLRADPGMPQQLALNVPPAVEQAAAEHSAQGPAQELPAAAEQTAAVNAEGVAQPTLSLAQETAPIAVAEAAPEPAASLQTAFADMPQPAVAAAPPPVVRAAPVRTQRTAARPVANGSHAVQLGSFSSPQGARRAWGIFAARNPALKNYKMVITPAVVHGRNFWRVAAAGFDRSAAQGMCSSVKNRGGVCFAYASGTLRPNVPTAPDRAGAGPAFARRR